MDDQEQALRRQLLFRPCETKDELKNWIKVFLDLDMPDSIVDEDSNSSPMDMLWEVYDNAHKNNNPDFYRVLYYACRDGFKTLGAAILEVLMLLHLDRDVAHMAAIEQQAQKAQSYVKAFFRKPYLRDFVEGDNLRETKIFRYYNPRTKHSLTRSEYENLSKSEKGKHQSIAKTLSEYKDKGQYIHVILCTMKSSNSEHVPFFCIDELDVVSNPAAYEEAKNVPAGRDGKLPITMLTSTRKSAFGLVQKEIEEAKKTGLQIRHWNLIDITESCPKTRHRPDLPRLPIYRSDDTLMAVSEEDFQAQPPGKEKDSYIKDEGYHGCLRNCKLFAVCKGRLATHQKSKSILLKRIDEVIPRFKQNELSIAKAQLLCRKPSSDGLVYARMDKSKHVISPARCYELVMGTLPDDPKWFNKAKMVQEMVNRRVSWYGGMDFGFSHNFAYVHGFKDGNRIFITHCVSMPELEPDQMVDAVSGFVQFNPKTYPDKENPQLIKLLKRNGWKMQNWKKRPGSVAGGIAVVQMKLNPTLGGDPEIYFISDVTEDPMMDLLIKNLCEYHWKRDAAGRPSNVPDEEGDDECDALRYLVMNVFDPKGTMISVQKEIVITTPTNQLDIGERQYSQANWIREVVAEKTGEDPGDRFISKNRKKISKGAYSYYADEDDDDTPSRGSRIVADI